jgi:hypothetical protein
LAGVLALLIVGDIALSTFAPFVHGWVIQNVLLSYALHFREPAGIARLTSREKRGGKDCGEFEIPQHPMRPIMFLPDGSFEYSGSSVPGLRYYYITSNEKICISNVPLRAPIDPVVGILLVNKKISCWSKPEQIELCREPI